MSNSERSITLAIYAMAFGNFAAGMSTLVIAGVLTEIATDIGVSTGQAGQLISIYSFAYAIGAPVIMALTSRFDRRLMLAAGMALVLAGNGLVALMSDFTLLIIARIITAIGAAAYVPLSAAVAIALAKPEERGRVSAIVFSGFTLATALGLPIGTYIGLNLGWRYTVALVAVLALIAGTLIWREVPSRIETPPVNLAVFRQVFRNGLLIVVLSVTVLQFAGQMAIFAFIAPWLQAFTSLGATGITLMLLLVGIGGIVGNYIAGLSTDRFGARATQLVLLIILIATLGSLPVIAQSLILGGILMFVWGFVGQGFISPQLVRIVGVNPTLSTASLSLNSSFINIGLSLGAVAGGVALDQFGAVSLTWLGVGGTVLSLFVFWLSWVMENSRGSTTLAEGAV